MDAQSHNSNSNCNSNYLLKSRNNPEVFKFAPIHNTLLLPATPVELHALAWRVRRAEGWWDRAPRTAAPGPRAAAAAAPAAAAALSSSVGPADGSGFRNAGASEQLRPNLSPQGFHSVCFVCFFNKKAKSSQRHVHLCTPEYYTRL